LLAQGLDYLSDELVFIPFGSQNMQGFCRPLHLKHPSRGVIGQYVLAKGHETACLSSPTEDIFPAQVFNARSHPSQPAMRLAVCVRYAPDADYEWLPLKSGQIGLALMQSLINARNLPENGFHEVADLARSLQAYRLTYRTFTQIAGEIKSCLEQLVTSYEA
jgi:hypothetical protein